MSADHDLSRARAAYEDALGKYENARVAPDRIGEYAAAREVDRTRRIYFMTRDAHGLHPESLRPAGAGIKHRRWRKLAPERPRVDALRVVLNVALPLILFAGLAVPIGIFAVNETQRGPSLQSSGSANGKGGGVVARAPVIALGRESGQRNAPRFLDLPFTSDLPLAQATAVVTPDPGVPCEAILDTPNAGRVRCLGVLAGGREFAVRITGAAVFGGASAALYEFRTQEQLTQLQGLRWFTEFEDPTQEPLACAAAAARIIQNFTTGQDKLSAYGILALGRQLNRSRDPGLDPAAIAEVLHRLDARNNYHYYIYATREEATRAAAAWIVRSGKPVVAITLGGQHAPLITGFTGEFGTGVNDPATRVAGIIVVDPQRGDLDPRTAQYRPDKSRSSSYQTGHELTLVEWYRDEWWLGSPYWYADRAGVPMDRNDGAYPLPHWGGNFVLIADDGDATNPSDRMGRVRLP